MKSMVVLFALVAAACGSLVPLAQPPHHPAVVLDARGRPLDTAEVIGARALHLQAKALEAHAPLSPLAHGPAVVAAPAVYAAPSVLAHSVHAAPSVSYWGAHAGLAAPLLGHGHYLHKRSLGHLAYSTPVVAPAAVSHQSRVDVISSPVVSHALAAPAVHAVAPAVIAAPAAVSHQSRVDYRASPVLSHSVLAPVVSHAAWAAPAVSSYGAWGLSHGAHAHLPYASLSHHGW